jgi:hypothetical protein
MYVLVISPTLPFKAMVLIVVLPEALGMVRRIRLTCLAYCHVRHYCQLSSIYSLLRMMSCKPLKAILNQSHLHSEPLGDPLNGEPDPKEILSIYFIGSPYSVSEKGINILNSQSK